MKEYILQITRANRGERPSQAQIITDSFNATLGNEAGVIQSKTDDNFFNLDSTMDLQQNVNRILSIMSFNPFAMTGGDGWRVLEYPHSDIWTQDYTQHSEEHVDEEGHIIITYADVWVQSTTETTSDTITFHGENALRDAENVINSLGASDGWVLGQEWGKTIVIDSTPSLWVYEGYVPLSGSKVNPVLERADKDRW